MLDKLKNYQGETLAVLRIFSGLLFMVHGLQKFFSFPMKFPFPLNPMLYTAGAIEIVGGILITIGLFTRPSAFICSGLMAVAYFMAHATRGFHPIMNGGELAIIYCFVFLYISTAGPGKWALDK